MRSRNSIDGGRILGQWFVLRVLFTLLFALLTLAPIASKATLLGDQVYLNVTTIDPPDILIFDGVAVVADAAVDFTFDDLALDALDDPKYVWSVDFIGPDGLTVVITATRTTPINDFNGHFRSFEFTGIHWLGDPRVITNATITGISGSQALKWQGGTTITEVGSDLFTFETGSWNSGGVVQGDTIIATIQLEVQDVPSTGDTYEYDALGRLTRVNYPDGRSLVYTYDRAGNIVRVPEPGTLSMLFAGILALVALDCRRRRRERIGEGRFIDACHAAVPHARALNLAAAAMIALLVLALPVDVQAQAGGGPARATDWQESVRERLESAEYEVSWSQARLRKATEAWQAPNRAHNFRTHFMDKGIRLTPREQAEDTWEFGLSLLSYGRGDQAIEAGRGTPRADGKRVRYHRGDVVEWYLNERRGLEQGFTLHAPPRTGRGAGARGLGVRLAAAANHLGPVYVALSVDGDARPVLAADRQSVQFVRTGAPIAIAHYDHLEVVDANGRVLDSWMEVFRDDSGRGIRLVFDDTDAAYPVEIDPLLTTPGWTVEGNQPAAGLGFSVAGAGDVNNDGYDDVLVGAPWYDGGDVDTGRAYLFLGAPTGLSQVPIWFAIGEATLGTRGAGPADARFGYAVAGAGDVDGDGFDDILVSRTPRQFPVSLHGQVFLYRGSPTGPGPIADWTLEGRAFRRMGYTISGAGDLNGDSYDDIVVGEPGGLQTDQQGRVYVFYGQPNEGAGNVLLGGGQRCTATPDGTPGTTCNGSALGTGVPAPAVWGDASSQNEYGEVVVAAGDVNCDPYDDLVIGQPRYDGEDRGRIQIFLGSPTGVNGNELAPDYELTGTTVRAALGQNFDLEFGRALVAAGPLDADPTSCGDILVGAPGRDPRISQGDTLDGNNNGAVYIIRGDDSVPPSFTWQELAVGTVDRGTFGASLANAGDVNDDGADDFLVGAPGEPNFAATAGRAYLLLGSTEMGVGLNKNPVWRADGAEANDYLGSDVAGAGDVDGDGFDDLLIGSASARGGRSTISEIPPTRPGAAFVFYGTAPALFADLLGDAISLQTVDSFAWSGEAQEGIGFLEDFSPGVGSGPSPGSVILSTGLAQDAATGRFDWNNDGEPDKVVAGLVLDKPAGATTLRFTTQYLTSDPAEEPRAEARITYKYNPGGLLVNDIDDTLILETPIERSGDGEAHNPISHAIDVSNPAISRIGLQIRVQEQATGGAAADSAVVLSKVFFSDVPVPDHLSPDPAEPTYAAECADLLSGPSDPEQDRNADCLVDYVANPRPSDVSASAGPFRFGLTLLDVPGKVIPFRFALSYDSERNREEQLGPKWSHSFASTAFETGDVEPVDSCSDTVFVYPGGGAVEVYEGEPNPAYNGTSNLVRCLFPARYPGVFSRLRSVPANSNLRYDHKGGYFSGYERIGATSQFRRSSYAHPNANRNLLWNYDAATGEIESIQDDRGELFFFEYDDSFDPARLVSVTGSAAQIGFDYSELGFLESVTDANGLTTTFTYDDDGNLLTITDADGTRIVSNEYESFAGLGVDQTGNRVIRQLNAQPGDLGRTTTFSGDALEIGDREDGRKLDRYDVFGRLVETRLLLDANVALDLQDCDRSDDWCAVTSFRYNEENLLVEQTDPRGIVTQLEYDAEGNLTCRTENVGGVEHRVAMLYDPGHNLVAELVQRDATDQPPPACPDPETTVVPEPARWLVTSYTYEPIFNYRLSRTDPLGRTTLFGYQQLDGDPEEGLLQTVTNPDLTVRSFDYDAPGLLSEVTNELGQVTQLTTDLMGRPASVTDPRPETTPGEFTSFVAYDAGGRLLRSIDPPLGFPTLNYEAYTYDAQGRQLTRRDGAGQIWTRAYTPTGQLAVEADPLLNTTQYGYDLENRLTSTIDPRGAATTRSYDAAGRVTSITNPLAAVYSFEYDKAGNVISETGPQIDFLVPSTTRYTYDERGRQSSVRDALDAVGDETVFTYDSRGQVLTRTEPAHPVLGARVWSATYTDTGQIASTANPEGVSATFSYDDLDRVDIETQDQTGRITDYDYDPAGRLTQVRVGVGTDVLTSTRAVYDAAGNNTAVTDPRNSLANLFEYDYDALNRVVRERDGLGNEVQLAYERRGLVETRTNARGQAVGLGYDAAGRLTSTSATDVTGSWTIMEALDANGNSTASTVTLEPSAAVSVQRVFDGLDRQTGRTVDLPTAPLPTSPSVATEYDPAGNVSKIVYSDGREVAYEYDALSRLVGVTDWDMNVTTYAYDEVGNVERVTRPDGSTATYGYDRAGRLLSVQDSNASLAAPILFQADFTLDAAGRRIGAVLDLPLDPTLEPDATFSYDAANRLVSRDGEVLVYDADGNLTSGTLGGSPRSLGYNALNQLVEIDGGAEIIRYDGDGRRASRQVGATTTYYVYDTAGRLIEEVDGAGSVIARYVHGLGLISRHDEGSGQASIYHFDSRGSTLALTDLATGAVTDAYAYTPYGGVQRDPANTTPNPFTYNGRDGVVDDGNGLYYMQARYYAPELMRFVQQDPVYDGELSRPQSLNRYAFVEGNPIEKIDPSGEFGFVGALVGAVTGAVTGIVVAAITGDDILEAAAQGAIAGAIIGGTGGAGLIGAGIGGGLSLAQGGSFSDVALGAAVGAASSVGLGAAVGASFLGGAVGAGGGFSEGAILNRLKAGGIDAAGALILGGAFKGAGKGLAKTNFGSRLARSGLARSATNTRVGRKLLPVTAGTRNAANKAGARLSKRGGTPLLAPGVGQAGRRGGVRLAASSVAEETVYVLYEDSARGLGVFLGKQVARNYQQIGTFGVSVYQGAQRELRNSASDLVVGFPLAPQ